ncbi:MAG: LCP family protein, partial [Clostridia bacterium]|nr:LCP family protein [Clostridia bacterium]
MKKKEVILNSFSSDETGFKHETGFKYENDTQSAPTMRFNAIEYSKEDAPRTTRTRSGAAASRSSSARKPRKRKSGNLIKRIKESAFFSNLTKKKKIMLLIAAVLLLVLLIGSCKFLFMLGNPLIGGDIDDDVRKAQDAVKNDMVSVLLVGTDGGGYNTDTIMLAVLNCKNNEISLISVPRDTRVPNPYGGSGYAKINSVYAAKGMAGLISQVKDVTGMPINFYAMINF